MSIDNPLDQEFLGNLYDSIREVIGDDLTRPKTMVIGQLASDGSITTSVTSGEYGLVWVREPGEDTGDAVQAINDVLQPHEVSANRPVQVKKQDGELHIVRKAPGSADYDALIPASPQRAVKRPQIDLALIRPSTPDTSFNVYYSGSIFTYNRTAYRVTDQPSNLLASVPGSDAVSVKIEVDPTTGIYTETVGASFPLQSLETAFGDGSLSTSVASGKYLYGWVRLYNGQTSIEQEDILIAENFLDLIDDHTKLSNLTGGDPHTQYLFTFPASDSRNVIQPTGDYNPLSINDPDGTLQFYFKSNGDLITDPVEPTNTLLGDGVGVPTSSQNTIIGAAAGADTITGIRNTAIGHGALGTLTSGNNNVVAGYGAGGALRQGARNTLIGQSAGASLETGSGNVIIGYLAGLSETGNNKLHIHNANTTTPLIYGDFSGGVTIYGQGAAAVSFRVQGEAAQSANIVEVEDSSANDLVSINQRGRLKLHDYATTPPLSVTERASAPSNAVEHDLYLDDGANTASTNPGWRRYDGTLWEDVSASAGGGGGTLVNAVILNPASTARNLIEPSGDYIALQLRQALAQTKNIFEVLANNNDFQVSINKRGRLRLHDSNVTPPLSMNDRSAAPANPVADDIYLDNGNNTTSGNNAFRRYTGSVWEDIGYDGVVSGFPTGYINQMDVSVIGTSTVEIYTGWARDTADAYDINVNGSLVIDTGVTGINGLDSSDGTLVAGEWYRVYALVGASGVGGFLSTKASPTLPSGYDQGKRRVGWARTNSASANLYQSTMNDGRVFYDEVLTGTGDFRLFTSANISNVSWTNSSLVQVCPPDISLAHFVANITPDASILISWRVNTNQQMWVTASVASTGGRQNVTTYMPVEDQAFEIISNAAGDENLTVNFHGYIDDREI